MKRVTDIWVLLVLVSSFRISGCFWELKVEAFFFPKELGKKDAAGSEEEEFCRNGLLL